ncbi:MAG: uncharacterized protein, YkwD family [Parcubacteria group bacterium Gr01-1014_13]|nr:MAG: uncharacterized protein, YkwD family [Parcubacteria group bacterium Gr01-1014_13]
MQRTLKKYFIPHAENNYHPHILHTKRTIFYSLVFLSSKLIIVLFALALPVAVFTSPDILPQEAKKVALLTNELRSQKNIALLNSDSKLSVAAAAKAADMIQKSYFSHTSPSGETVADFVRKIGYRYIVVGENLAIGYATAEELVSAWEKSPTHMANLVDRDYIDLGVSLEAGDYNGRASIFAVQHFAEPVNLSTTEIAKPAAKSTSTLAVVSGTENNSSPNSQINSAQNTSVVLSEKINTPVLANGTLMGRPFWENPVQKYQRAKGVSSVNSIFGLSRNIFLLAIIFFSLALALSILIEFKKQHPHVIAQTTGLVGLLVVLFLV